MGPRGGEAHGAPRARSTRAPTCENGGLAQLARAPALQAGGHRFDSDILHFNLRSFNKGDNGEGKNRERNREDENVSSHATFCVDLIRKAERSRKQNQVGQTRPSKIEEVRSQGKVKGEINQLLAHRLRF